MSVSAWRPEDEVLLQRLEDEGLAERLFFVLVGDRGDKTTRLHSRAGGIVGEVRKLPGGADAVAAACGGDIARLGRFLDGVVLRTAPPALLHHLALFHAKAATALERNAPDLAANAWIWSLASWLALAEERVYLSKLEEAVLGSAAKTAGIPPERVPLELIAEMGRRADASARDLTAPGTAALVALSNSAEAARIAGIPDESARRLKIEASRRRNSAIESALNVIADGLDEANVRGELATAGRTLILRAVAVWSWTGRDEAVEHFVISQLDRIGWDLYRLRDWTSLRYLMDPFRPMMESLAARVEKDPSQLAYSSGCAQMFVFMAETEPNPSTKLALAERALSVCPTHRNARVVLASMLCDRAMASLREMIVRRTAEIERVEAMIVRAETLYPQSRELPEAKKKLETVKRQGRITW